jgi:outer membrane protein assembly factor BamA
MVKYVPEEQYLLSDNTIVIDNKEISKEELSSNLRQEENLKIVGFLKFHLWVYSLSNNKDKEDWLKRIGEPPVIYDEGLKNKSVSQLQQYMHNKGYYNAEVDDTTLFKGKKAYVNYTIKSGTPYRIKDIKYTIKDNSLTKMLELDKTERLIHRGDILDLTLLGNERTRIATALQNGGYYRFVEDYIHFKIDTAFNANEATVEMIVENARYKQTANDEVNHKKYIVDGYSIYIDKQKKGLISNEAQVFADTTIAGSYLFLHNGKLPIRSDVFSKSIELSPNSLFSKRLVDKTYNNLYALRQFKYINIQFQEDTVSKDLALGHLKGKIFLPLQSLQNYSVDVEGTNTSGNLGVAGNLNYQHRNLLGGAEIFDISFKGASERQDALINNERTIFNTLEYGGSAKLSVPGFLFPVSLLKAKVFSMPYTSISFTYNFQERPDYSRTIVNATFGYFWKSNQLFSHNLNLLDLNAVQIFRLNPEFENKIKDLYIKSSYTDHIISATNYGFTYNTQGIKNLPFYHYFRVNMESSGNTLYLASNLLGLEKSSLTNSADKDQSAFYKIFDTRFAQYLKADLDYRYGYRFDKYNAIATHAFLGAAYPYGNFHVTPFERRYFSGGANGVRAWQVRSLGPGSYKAGIDEYPNQSADIKLEASLEYRYKLFWMFEGAFFLDAGNIWAINNNDNRDGAVFQFNDFYKEIALGTGVGLRLVYTYFIIRADLGLKLCDPSQEIGERWIPFSRSYNLSDLNFNIAIGYPF